MSKNSERMDALHSDLQKKIAECNQIIKEGTAADVDAKLTEISTVEGQYLKLKEKEVYGSLPTPRDALVMLQFETISHKKLTNKGVLTGIEECSKKIFVDMKAYCEYYSMDTDWWYDLQALNKRLTMRVAESIGVDADGLSDIDKSYYMDKFAEQIKRGETPYSNTQCEKHIQRIFDTLCPDDEHRVDNKDLNFILGGYTKVSSKEALKLVCSKHADFLKLITRAFNRILTDASYSVDYKKKKEEKAATVEAAPVAAPVAAESAA